MLGTPQELRMKKCCIDKSSCCIAEECAGWVWELKVENVSSNPPKQKIVKTGLGGCGHIYSSPPYEISLG